MSRDDSVGDKYVYESRTEKSVVAPSSPRGCASTRSGKSDAAMVVGIPLKCRNRSLRAAAEPLG